MKLTPTSGLLGFGAKSIAGLTYSTVPNIWPLGSAGLNFSDSQTFSNFKGGACVNSFLYWREKNLLNGAKETEWTTLNNKFKDPYGRAKGCVAVSWNKETWNDNKWKGIIRYEWLFTMGPESLITHGLYSTKEDSSKIKWRTVYINASKNKSALKIWEGVTPSTMMPKSPNFPYRGENYFGFNPDFEKICAQSECSGGAKATKSEAKWSWEADGHGGKKFSDWTSNWASLGLFAWAGDLSQFDELAKKGEGTWTER